MLQDLQHFPDQFTFTEHVKGKKKKYENIVVAAMGGSAFPANIAKDNYSLENLHVWREYKLPSFSSNKSLVIAISHSGNTEETLSAAKQAQKEGFELVIIAAGGKLLKMAQKEGITHIQIPSNNIQPRLATGYMLSAIAQVLFAYGIIEDPQKEFDTLSLFLQKALKEQKKMFALAGKMEGHLPVIYADTQFKTLARIAIIKCNENAKHPAFYNMLPELNHNEMIGWTRAPFKPYFLFFEDPKAGVKIKKRFAVLQKIFKKMKYKSHSFELQGKTYLQKVFYQLILMDFITIKMAMNAGVDPASVPMVEDFKKML